MYHFWLHDLFKMYTVIQNNYNNNNKGVKIRNAKKSLYLKLTLDL